MESDDETRAIDRIVRISKALADPVRLRILGLLAERPRTGKEIAESAGVGPPTVSHHMDKLTVAGLVTVERAGQSRRYSLNQRALRELTALAAEIASDHQGIPTAPAGTRPAADSNARFAVIREFFVGDRLIQIPARRNKRVLVLQHLLEGFEPNRDYPEQEVNAILTRAHEDFATLRRELVDYGYLTRSGGVYRVASAPPERGANMRQEIPEDERAWLRGLIARSTLQTG